MVQAKQPSDLVRRAVTPLDPDHLRRMTKHETPLVKVCILRHDDVPLAGGIVPDCAVVGGLRPSFLTWVESGYRSLRRASRRRTNAVLITAPTVSPSDRGFRVFLLICGPQI